MCHQAVCLIQAECERQGMTTVSVSMLPEISRTMRAPRVLSVPFTLGHPFGEPDDVEGQRLVIEAMLSLCSRVDVPVMESLT